jgi:hypothetical protein
MSRQEFTTFTAGELPEQLRARLLTTSIALQSHVCLASSCSGCLQPGRASTILADSGPLCPLQVVDGAEDRALQGHEGAVEEQAHQGQEGAAEEQALQGHDDASAVGASAEVRRTAETLRVAATGKHH